MEVVREIAEEERAREAAKADGDTIMATGDSTEEALLEVMEEMEGLCGGRLAESRHAPQLARRYTANGNRGTSRPRQTNPPRPRKGKGKEMIGLLDISNATRAPATMRQNIAALTQTPPRTILKRPETAAGAFEKKAFGRAYDDVHSVPFSTEELQTKKNVSRREMAPSRETNHRPYLSGCWP